MQLSSIVQAFDTQARMASFLIPLGAEQNLSYTLPFNKFPII